MELNFVKFTGFKRFEDAKLKTTGKIIALVGANEVGKSSILQALPFLTNDSSLNNHYWLTRNKKFKEEDIILQAGFFA
jgi:predicted ATP-dependent endonuclease of OLD family